MSISQRDQAVLDFERSWWLIPGPKDRAIKEHLSISATHYYRLLRHLADDPEAEEYDPLTVRRLRRSARRKAVRRITAEGEEF